MVFKKRDLQSISNGTLYMNIIKKKKDHRTSYNIENMWLTAL